MNRAERRQAEREMAKLGSELQRLGGDLYDTLPVNVRDQHEAAAKDAYRALKGVGQRIGWRSATTAGGRVNEAIAVLNLAMATRVKEFCPHARTGPILGKRTFVHLSTGWVACESCAPTYKMNDPKLDDGRCDICDLPAPNNMFTEHAIQTGTVIWMANVGECCEDKL